VCYLYNAILKDYGMGIPSKGQTRSMQASSSRAPLLHADHAAWRREPRAFTQVLDAVSAVNSQLLDALASSARGEATQFPLVESLRERAAKLTLEGRRRAARSGVFLVDANLIDFSWWREAALRDASPPLTDLPIPWLPLEEARSLAHSALLVAWYVIHADAAIARVLLGMSASAVAAYRELGVSDLAQIARRHPECVRPRWPNRLDVWGELIEGAGEGRTQRSRWATLRCLELSAGDLKWLSAYVEDTV
jgi:hypothetical protein